jgi:hypothetical protein
MLMQFAMMQPAQGNRKLIAHFSTQSGWLGKFEVMGVGRSVAADQAGLLGHKPAMFPVAKAQRLGGDTPPSPSPVF